MKLSLISFNIAETFSIIKTSSNFSNIDTRLLDDLLA